MRLYTLCLVILLAICGYAQDAKTLVGKWLPEKNVNSRLESLDLQKDGKFVLVMCVSDTNVKQPGTWTLKGRALSLAFTKGPTWKAEVAQDGKTILMLNPRSKKLEPIFKKK